MKSDLPISSQACSIVTRLQESGFETYIVGGAIRDLLLGRTPKDFDIGTSATPEEVRCVFGRRNCRIIGKRFRLAHVFGRGNQLFEVSTFRRAPSNGEENTPKKTDGIPNENLLLNDNEFGTAQEDAFRRDFTVNSLFYDPVKKEILDFTGMGMADISRRIVRAIGDPALRFEEDPVRMLRALKLVAQFDFELDNDTENALFPRLPLLSSVASSRLNLELEKILISDYSDRHFEVMHDYGLLKYFLPHLDAAWSSEACRYAMKLLFERNCRIEEKYYRPSISIACALLVLPFAEALLSGSVGLIYRRGRENRAVFEEVFKDIFHPMPLMVRLRDAAIRILDLLPQLLGTEKSRDIYRNRMYDHAREAAIIIGVVSGLDPDELAKRWPQISEADLPPKPHKKDFRKTQIRK